MSYNKSLKLDGSIADKPYLSKEMLYVIDNNGSTNYSRNQVEFETVSLSNNGKWCDYRNGYISIPVVTVLTSTVNFIGGDKENGILFKSDYCNIIDSVTIDYGNNNKIQQNANISPYLVFKKHTTFSENDVIVNGHTLGYRKDGHKWDYENNAGIMNCLDSSNQQESQCTNHKANQLFVMGATAKSSGDNVYEEPDAQTHVFYHDCIIRLKDLLFFDQLPMVRGANVKITLRLNQVTSSAMTRAGSETTLYESQLTGSVFPVMRRVLQEATNSISVKVVENGAYRHEKSQCRLYVPVYTMAPSFEDKYLAVSQKKVTYEDVFVTHLRGLTANFQAVLTNSLSRMQRLVIVPILSASGNGARKIPPMESPYASEPSTCSPHYIRDFNVQLSGSNIYKQNVNYKYEQFLNELCGTFGTNANQVTGLTSSLISQKDYNENYGYIVVDLSRRYNYDNETPMSVQINGIIASPKALDFVCYITYLKDTTIDLLTGQELP